MGGSGDQGKQFFRGSGHIVQGLPRWLWGRGEVALKRPWSREVVISFEAGSDPPKCLWSREARLSYEVDLGPPRWRRSSGETGFPRKRACCSGSAWSLLGWLWGRVKRAYRSKSAWVSPRRLRSREVACRSGPALPACCRISPVRTRKWSSPRLVCRRRTNLTLVSSEVVEMVRF